MTFLIFIPTNGCNSNVSQISKCIKIVQGLKNDGDNLIIVSLPLHFSEVCVHHLKAVVKHMMLPLIKRSKYTRVQFYCSSLMLQLWL